MKRHDTYFVLESSSPDSGDIDSHMNKYHIDCSFTLCLSGTIHVVSEPCKGQVLSALDMVSHFNIQDACYCSWYGLASCIPVITWVPIFMQECVYTYVTQYSVYITMSVLLFSPQQWLHCVCIIGWWICTIFSKCVLYDYMCFCMYLMTYMCYVRTISQGLGAYSVSKTALFGLTRALSVELGVENIRVNCLAPGVIKTKFSSVVSNHV